MNDKEINEKLVSDKVIEGIMEDMDKLISVTCIQCKNKIVFAVPAEGFDE